MSGPRLVQLIIFIAPNIDCRAFSILTPVWPGDVFVARHFGIAAKLRSGAFISSTSGASLLPFAFRAGQRETEGAKNYLWFQKVIFGQAIFIGVTKSITLTSPGAIA